MANQEHLEILKQGVGVWNTWRKQKQERGSLDLASYLIHLLEEDITPDLSEVDLSGMNLSDADLSQAILRDSNLSGVNLHAASLVGADLSGACLRDAQLGFADLALGVLNNANLAGASFFRTSLHETVLTNSDFLNAQMALTIISNVDLRGIRNLESVIHHAPSTIGIDTIHKSRGNIPEVFLRGCGVPEFFIIEIRGMMESLESSQFYSCFISYSHKDEEFARRLYSRMIEAKLRVWYAPEEMKGGGKLHEQIFSAIQVHDKLLLVLSENSLQSEWVMTEIRKARKVEREENRRMLFPIRLVDFDAIQEWECFDADSGKDLALELREYFIPNFSNWKDQDAFETAFNKLLRDLKAEET